MLQLTADEQAWLDSYRAALDKKHPGAVHEMLIYGSKARGQAHAESDVDVLLIVKDDAVELQERSAMDRLSARGENRRVALYSRLHRG